MCTLSKDWKVKAPTGFQLSRRQMFIDPISFQKKLQLRSVKLDHTIELLNHATTSSISIEGLRHGSCTREERPSDLLLKKLRPCRPLESNETTPANPCDPARFLTNNLKTAHQPWEVWPQVLPSMCTESHTQIIQQGQNSRHATETTTKKKTHKQS